MKKEDVERLFPKYQIFSKHESMDSVTIYTNIFGSFLTVTKDHADKIIREQHRLVDEVRKLHKWMNLIIEGRKYSSGAEKVAPIVNCRSNPDFTYRIPPNSGRVRLPKDPTILQTWFSGESLYLEVGKKLYEEEQTFLVFMVTKDMEAPRICIEKGKCVGSVIFKLTEHYRVYLVPEGKPTLKV